MPWRGQPPPAPLSALRADTRLPPLRGLNRRPRNTPLRTGSFLWGNMFPHTPCDADTSLGWGDIEPFGILLG